MDNRLFWNDVAKYGLMLGIVMGGSKIFEQSLVIFGGAIDYAGWVLVEWVTFAVLFFAILYRATKRRAAAIDPKLGFSYAQGVNYMMLVSAFAAVPVACIYYVYINSIVGYDNYVEALIAVVISAAELQPMDSSTADVLEMLVDQLREQPQASIFSTLFSTIFQYLFAGLFAGLILAGYTKRKAEIFKTDDEL